jgi:Domain of unknown function (DUF4272)
MTTDKYRIKTRIMMKDVYPSAEALARKQRSIDRLKAEGVWFIDHLPVIEDSQSALKRTAEEIAQRAVALHLVALKGEGLEEPIVQDLVEHFGAREFFTPEEKAFIENPAPGGHDRLQFSWRYEACWVLLWALGYIERLGFPDKNCDAPRSVQILADKTTADFAAGSKLRSLTEILDEADLTYRYSWAARNARLTEKDPPAGLDEEITVERHHAFNWLIGYLEQEWDDITTDT